MKNYDMLKITKKTQTKQDQAWQDKMRQHPHKKVSPGFEKYST